MIQPGVEITVLKLNLSGQETWRYSGTLLKASPHARLVRALFNRPDLPFHEIILGQGDPFIEIYFDNHWYNIFEIHDRVDDRIKAWYCNITLPARFEGTGISYIDLALDLLVYPDGRMLVLDEDEFADLNLDETRQTEARRAMIELQGLFHDPANVRLGDFMVED